MMSKDKIEAKTAETFEALFKQKIQETEALLVTFLPEKTGYQKTIFEAMAYSVMAGGKRLRPLLIKETAEFFGGADDRICGPFMAAIEMIHTYSLIHDDLPALDNDDYRRGRLTSHKVFGEAMAILAGDALLNYAYETASKAFDQAYEDPELLKRTVRAMQILTRKPGIYGMIGGQVVDVELTGQAIPEEVLHFIFELKTGALIEACMMMGAVLAGADEEQVALMEKAAHDIGMAFQIQDDILDVTSTVEELGKPVHSDEKNEKTTWVTLYGMDQAVKDVSTYSESALEILKGLRQDAEETFLYRFVEWLIHRNH